MHRSLFFACLSCTSYELFNTTLRNNLSAHYSPLIAMASKSLAPVVDPKDIAPNWKVLQMKLKEASANAPPKEKKPLPFKRKAKKRKAEGELGPREPKKFAEEIPVLSEARDKGDLTPIVALDCEYVGVGDDGTDDALARVSIVNEEGNVAYDIFVKPKSRVVDYRTHVSGIRPAHLANAARFEDVQKEVHRMLAGRIVVGHALHNDFRVLGLTHPRKLTRDTARCQAIKAMLVPKVAHPSLKLLAKNLLGIEIQQGEHDSIVDARVALRIYLNMKKQWEDEVRRLGGGK